LKKSFKKMYCQTPDEEPPVAPAAPDVSKHWYKHELVQSSRQVISRLKNKSPTKVAAGEAIIQDVIESKDGDLSRPLLQARAEPLRENRYSYWNKPVTQSQEHLDHAMDTYFRHQAVPA
jgi:hypothetical protein